MMLIHHFYDELGVVYGVYKLFCFNLRANLVLRVVARLVVVDLAGLVDGRNFRKVWCLGQCGIERSGKSVVAMFSTVGKSTVLINLTILSKLGW